MPLWKRNIIDDGLVVVFLILLGITLMAGCSSNESTESNSNEWETISANTKQSDTSGEYSRNPGPREALGSATRPSLDSDVSKRMYREYGAVFFSGNGARTPPKVVFESESEVSRWQSSVSIQTETLNGVTVQLQKPAMEALLRVVKEAESKGLTITPRGSDAARRNYAGTLNLWKSRVEPGLDYWVARGKLSETEAVKVRSLGTNAQIGKIFELERRGLFFSKDNSKSIIYSVAPPGTSQHISMLALDVSEHDNPAVRQLLASQGWFQTVVSDTPHFTYLGLQQDQLGSVGLKSVTNGGRIYWIPGR